MNSRLSMDRAFTVLMQATGTGAVLTALMFAVLFSLQSMSWAVFVGTAIAALVVSAPAWCAGLLLFGAPCWWLLHRLGVRSRWAGAVAGALLAGLTAAALVATSPSTARSWIPGVIGVTAIGALVGVQIVTQAYGKGRRP